MQSVIRTIHPIGQGGFVSEYLPESDHLVIYDCGTKTSGVGNRIDAVFDSLPKECVDILFISHFDEDHVSLIPKLRKRKCIKKVIMPLMNDAERSLISLLSGNKELSRMIFAPEEFFDKETAIVKVKRYEEGDEIREIAEEDASRRAGIVKSNSVITAKNGWEYIPFNFEGGERSKQFRKVCSQNGIDVDKMAGDSDYVIDNIKVLRHIYHDKRIEGTINENAMLLYSGARNEGAVGMLGWGGTMEMSPPEYEMLSFHTFFDARKGACLYTGDCDWSAARTFCGCLKSGREERFDRIELFQIPHHGSEKSDDIGAQRFLSSLGTGWDCFVQFGTRNRYGHPSIDILDAVPSSKCLLLATEKRLELRKSAPALIGKTANCFSPALARKMFSYWLKEHNL